MRRQRTRLRRMQSKDLKMAKKVDGEKVKRSRPGRLIFSLSVGVHRHVNGSATATPAFVSPVEICHFLGGFAAWDSETKCMIGLYELKPRQAGLVKRARSRSTTGSQGPATAVSSKSIGERLSHSSNSRGRGRENLKLR